MRFVFVMDTLDRVTHDKDTTFAFIHAAQGRGHECWHCLPRDLWVVAAEAYATARRVFVQDEPPWILLDPNAAPSRLALSSVEAVFVRKDPPFDAAYLYATLLLEHARGKTLVVNDPRGLRDANEK